MDTLNGFDIWHIKLLENVNYFQKKEKDIYKHTF